MRGDGTAGGGGGAAGGGGAISSVSSRSSMFVGSLGPLGTGSLLERSVRTDITSASTRRASASGSTKTPAENAVCTSQPRRWSRSTQWRSRRRRLGSAT